MITDNDANSLLEKDVDFSLEDDFESNFSSVYSSNVAKLLKSLNISLMASSYQAQRVFFVRTDGQEVNTNFIPFKRPMGIAAHGDTITLGTFDRVIKFVRNDGVIEHLDDNSKLDACFTPSAMHITGMINIHDIAYGEDALYIVNSAFSCIGKIISEYSFEVVWSPPFISELVPEDRCHLNGMALKDGRPKYVTAFSQFDSKGAWKKNKQASGVLIDINSNEILVDNLFMPHSPRYKNGKVYFCESAYGAVFSYDVLTREKCLLVTLPGYTRGIDFYGPLMFVGLSKVKCQKEEEKLPLPLSDQET
ncbi:MAG: TIGR03032 family protein, partial [Gammaproteobacteria bacterium]|nr:TIGR03032 family protein [Gammaproteobacteria bacterium]